jgi:hypothetical protein
VEADDLDLQATTFVVELRALLQPATVAANA